MPPKKKPRLQCDKCNATFSDQNNLKPHQDSVHGITTNQNNLKPHQDTVNGITSDQNNLKPHQDTVHDITSDQNNLKPHQDTVHDITSDQNNLKPHQDTVHGITSDQNNLKPHQDTVHGITSDQNNLKPHQDMVHDITSDQNKLKCRKCSETFSGDDSLKRQIENKRKDSQWKEKLNMQMTALDGSVVKHTYELKNDNKYDVYQALVSVKDKLQMYILSYLDKYGSMKAYVAMQILFFKATGECNASFPFFRSCNFKVLRKGDEEEDLEISFKKILDSIAKYQQEGSNWVLIEIISVQLCIIRYDPMPGPSNKSIPGPMTGSSYIKTPEWLRKKMAIINVKNPHDNECFKWSILSALHNIDIKRDPQRLSHYVKLKHDLNFKGLEFPIKIDDVKLFERQNEDLSVNVLGYNTDNIIKPLYMTSKRRVKNHVNLLLITDGDTGHYCWIKNFSRLMGDQKKDHNKHSYCDFCFYHTKDEHKLQAHSTHCLLNDNQITKLPSENNKIMSFKLKGLQTRLKIPVVIYADFECILVPCEEPVGQNPHAQKRKIINTHKPCGFAYKVVGITDEFSKEVTVYRGEDAAERCVELLLKEQTWFQNIKEKVLKMTPEDEHYFKQSTTCWICEEPFLKNQVKVRDHCHYQGSYRGAAHQKCNINYKKVKFIPVIMHNLSRYDSHIIMQAKNIPGNRRLECIPLSIDRYTSFTIGSLRFIDSSLFLNSSLETLVENLAKDEASKRENFKHTFSLAPNNPDKVSLILKRKVYPYEYMTGHDKFKEKDLPAIDKFQSILKDENISQGDYEHAQKVWAKFGMKTLGDYHDLYVKTDVLLLADVFEQFRKTSLENYTLDPAHFYTTPGLAWQAALMKTGVNVELLTDKDMHLMIESGIKGGVAIISHRYSKANNPFVPGFDSNKPNKWIIYLDANNLYGWAMSQPLPIGEYKWVPEQEISDVEYKILKDIDTFKLHESDDETLGYIFEVDLEYPEELHDKHNEFPLAPEKLKVTSEMLSPFCKNLLECLNMKEPSGYKLIPNLKRKEKYVIHYRTLKLYLKLGMKLTKVHRVMSFRQEPWLKPYIDFNTDKRKKSEDAAQKDFFKLMNNSVYGKTIENVRKYKDVKFVTDTKQLLKLTAKPNFQSFRIFNKYLVAIEMTKREAKLYKPIQVGFSVLDLAKAFIYDFHYSHIKAKYEEKAKLLFTDTDSLCYEIETENVYTDLHDLHDKQDLYDFSNYPKEHELFSDQNKNVVGKMKDETQGVPIECFVGLRPKMYALKYGEQSKMAAHGVNKEHAKRKILFENYEACLFAKNVQKSDSVTSESSNHELHTVKGPRVTLSPYDDKRFIHQDGISSYAYGHKRISETDL